MLRDLFHALRWLRGHRMFAIAVTAILGLGAGANTAVFSVVDAVLLHALPYESSPGLVRIIGASAKRPNLAISVADYLTLANHPDLLRSSAPMIRDFITLTGAGEPDQLVALRTTGALFPMLGVPARLGRALTNADDQPGSPNLAVLSDRLWRRHFGAEPTAVGRTITVSGDLYTITGVMPPEFDFPAPEVEMWVNTHLTNATPGPVQVAARLLPGITPAQAQAALQPVARQLEEKAPIDKLGLRLDVTAWSTVMPRENRLTLIFILAAVGLVLLIACADVSGLLLSRAVERQREIAIRASLGAGLWPIARQLLSEGLALAVLGSIAGAAVGAGALRILTRQLSALPAALPHLNRIALNGRVLAFNTAVCLAMAVLCSLAPVLFARKTDLQASLRGSQGSRPHNSARLFSILIAAQTAFAFLLLAGSGLMLRSLIRLQETDRGFQPEHVLTLRVPVGTLAQGQAKGKYDTRPRQIAYYGEILEHLKRVPGVIAAAFVNNIPLSGATTTLTTEKAGVQVNARTISGDYFKAMGIPLIEGRFFTDADRDGAPPVVIVNQTLLHQQYPDRDPVGQPPSGKSPMVVGVVKDATQTSAYDGVKPEMYLPYRQLIFGAFLSTFVVRTSGDPVKLAGALEKEVWAVDPDQPVVKVETMDDLVADSIWRPRFSAWVFSVLGGLALLLTCAGIYSIIAYTATLRAREVGIRVALGAAPANIAALILRDAMGPLLIGLGISGLAAQPLARLMSGLLFETKPTDPLSYSGAAAALVIMGIIASARPAFAAATADPLTSLRSE